MHQFAGCGISQQTDKTHSYFRTLLVYLINIKVSRRYFDIIIIDKNIIILVVYLFVQ